MEFLEFLLRTGLLCCPLPSSPLPSLSLYPLTPASCPALTPTPDHREGGGGPWVSESGIRAEKTQPKGEECRGEKGGGALSGYNEMLTGLAEKHPPFCE